MPDGTTLTALAPPAVPQQKRFRARWVSPLLRRILLVNALPLALLVAALLYLDQYQNGLLEAEVSALREQARIYAGALGESAVRTTEPDNPKLVPDIARPLLRRLTDPTPGRAGQAVRAGRHGDRRFPGARGTERRGQHRAAAAGGGTRADRRRGRLGLRQGADAAAARDADAAGGRHDAGRGRSGVAAGREGGAAAQQLRPEPRDAALHPAHQGQPAAGDGGRAGRARSPHRRHHPADARCARGGYQPVRRAHLHPGAVRPGAGSDGAAVVVSVADDRAADPAAGRCRGRDARGPRPRGQRAGAAAGSGATRSARWRPRCRIRRRRCSRAWTRSRSSPPTWRTRSRTRCRRSAARSRRCAASRIRSGRSSC